MKQQTNTLQTDNSVEQLLEALKQQNELYKQVLAGLAPIAEKSKIENRRGVLKFSKKEILQMPTNYRNVFATNDMIVHYRLRKDGVYEARFHRQGIHIEVSSKDLTKLKQKFIDKLNHKDEQPDKKDKTFAEYADEWLNIKKVTTKQSTCNEYIRLLNHDVLPAFGEIKAIEIDLSLIHISEPTRP